MNYLIRKVLFFSYVFFNEGGDIIPKITQSAQRPACIVLQDNNEESLKDRIIKNERILKSKIILE